MSFTVSASLLDATKSPQLKHLRTYHKGTRADVEFEVDLAHIDDAGLGDLIAAAQVVNDRKTERAIESILRARAGQFDKPIPNFKAFKGALEAFLKSELIDGWIYVRGDDDKLYPQLVSDISYEDGSRYGRGSGSISVTIRTTSYGHDRDNNRDHAIGFHSATHVFTPQQVSNRRLADILAAEGIYKETPALREAHLASVEGHHKNTRNAFARQFRVKGAAYQYEEDNYKRRGDDLQGRRVIHDLDATDAGPVRPYSDSCLFERSEKGAGVGPVPEHPVVRVFDLRTHEFFWINADNLEPYEYDKSLRQKLVLPPTHRDLLDVLTTDLDAFVEDIIEGKSAGNVILCKGVPGVGKTLTAEVYAELIERPLYSIHTGTLGTKAADIEENLKEVFRACKRWNCVLLLDEADVFVVRRGDNIEQNAIVAEFLRTLEYFDGLLFMTTNRPDDIDEAIVSRCAAIIDYLVPPPDDAARIWRVTASQHSVALGDDLILQLVELFPGIAPRDIKMLLRLVARVSKSHSEPLTPELFRRCAMFRAIKMRPGGDTPVTINDQLVRRPLTEREIDQIAADGMRNATGGIYPTSVYEFAREIERAHGVPQGDHEAGEVAGVGN
ncbi:MAG: AAA family ATPase [Burkholderiaceae bacterium]|nr:MAG: AAA family ATPase [Burkholderiaceae bacterium]TBR76847.1 MAG: AAA family ATPase [Burkholderiaceae bacterium]